MESNQLPILVKNQIPEYIVESYPIFVDFIETYYKYANGRKAGIGSIQARAADSDIDTALDEYIDEFYRTYGNQLPTMVAMDKRNFVKLLNSIYSAKGTENALKLLFQGIFGERISVTYPGQYVLRASDGKWIQERFFSASTKFGTLPPLPYNITFGNSRGDFSVYISSIDQLDPVFTRFFFDAKKDIYVEDNQTFTIYNNVGEIVWAGQLVTTPGYLSIVSGGRDWQVGQVVTIPGQYKDSIGRVTSVNSIGAIKTIEVLEHGSGHSPHQIAIVSPYPNVPPASTVTISSEMVSFDPLVYNHTIGIIDYTDGMSETIQGITDGAGPGSYFLENYVTQGYSGGVVINSTSSTGSSVQSQQDLGLTYEQWLASRAVLDYTPQNVVKVRGYYANFDGHISNQEIRLQDNFFYQAFSYLIDTTHEIDKFKSTVNMVHPAGTKMFSNLIKQVGYEFTIDTSRTLSLDTAYINDSMTTDDTETKSFTKFVQDAYGILETMNLILNKTLVDSIFVSTLDTADFVQISYADLDYTEEKYAVYEQTLTLG